MSSVVATALVFGGCAFGGLRINATGSLPVGIYVISSAPNAHLVEFCPPGVFSELSVRRGYRHRGACLDGGSPLLKPIMAGSGDVVDFAATGFRVNGVPIPNTCPRARDREGRPLPHWPFGEYRVPPETVWVASSYNPYSFDSRYFGPIPIAAIRNYLRPLITL
jgi:conjugative transfer signal peptidase TraF